MSQLKGSGGKPKAPPSPVNTPDNLRSADTVEMVLGLSEGPIKGLTNGHKSFYVGDTVLQRQDGEYNFQDFDLKIFPGDHTPEMLKYRLGGESSNNQVGVSLAYGIPVTRQTQHGNIDAIDIRLVVSALYKQVQEGKNPGVFDHTFNFAIRYKPVSASSWGDWYDAGSIMQPTNPHVSEWDSSWSEDSYQDGSGNWLDPRDQKQWSNAGWFSGVLWYRDQLANQPGGAPPYGNLFIRGKTTSAYVKEFRIPVQRIPEPYQIQIQRLTPDSSLGGDPQYIAEVSWESFQTIDTTPKFYPNTAIAQVVAKSTDQFSSIPQMWGVYDGLIVRVPSNYNP
jgi:predicted phage tail protein